ncbi:MAG: FHA domain-containing protein [Pseudobdellovibrionaceae bacterium]
MMKLVVKVKNEIVQELQLEEGKTYVIGRKQDADVVLQKEKGISREHFSLKQENGQWLVEVTSKFGGLKLNGKEIRNHVWGVNEVLKLKMFEFSIFDSENPSHLEGYSQDDNSPYVSEHQASHDIQSFDYQADRQYNDEAVDSAVDESEKTVIRKSSLTPILKLIDVHGNEIESYDLLGGDTWVAGRDSSNAIVISDNKVSRRQFEIKKIESRYAVIDLKSVNGTYVNGQPISVESYTYLKSQDQINVLSNHYRFELYDKSLVKSLSELKAPAVHSSVLQIAHPDLPPLSMQHAHQQFQQNYNSQLPQNYDPQYGGYQQNDQQPYIPPVKTQFEAFQSRLFENKMRSGLVSLILLVMIYYAYESFTGTSKTPGTSRQPTSQNLDPLASLPPEKRKHIETSYRMAKTFYMNGKYELCKGELAKLSEFNIVSYLDSQDLVNLCDEGISRQDQLRRLDQDEKMKIEMEQKIQQKVAECRPTALKSANPADLEQCLQGVLDLNPDHPLIQELRAQVDQNRRQNLMNQANRDRYAELSQRLKNMFSQAQSAEAKEGGLEAIPLYQKVARSDLPDTGNYKSEAKRKIASIQREVSVKTQSYLSSAEKFYRAGDMKKAILNLRRVRTIDPDNPEVHERIENYESQLSKRMKEIYEESVVEESYGNVVGTEGKDGAVEKWKKIIKLDVPGNEYFEKARKKLRMYKAM